MKRNRRHGDEREVRKTELNGDEKMFCILVMKVALHLSSPVEFEAFVCSLHVCAKAIKDLKSHEFTV